MPPNPYQPPNDLPTVEEPPRWTQWVRAIRRLWYGPDRDRKSVRFIMSGRPFFEYGVVFCALPKADACFFAKLPLVVDDEEHRQRNIAEAARVLRQLTARVPGLDKTLNSYNLVLSMVPSYEQLETELCRVVIPPQQWRGEEPTEPAGDETP